MKRDKEIVKRVEDIYKWLDEQIAAHRKEAGECTACGKCCDFDTFGHRLFVTPPEMIFFISQLHHGNASSVIPATCLHSHVVGGCPGVLSACRAGKAGIQKCPYQQSHKCTVYDFRFAGCRIFCCRGDSRFQSDLTEAVIKKFKALCDEFKIPYRYIELPALLKEANGLCDETGCDSYL